ncbi:MAG: hypothetical protein M3389_00725 [Actinomycetota bacterium]|nr:hypothetical protein [Actinomycetota bacterium]
MSPERAPSEWTFATARDVKADPSARAALEAAATELPHAVLFAAVVPGDEAWPRILDKEDAIEACRHGLVALRAVQPGALLVRGEPPRSFSETARLLTDGRGYLVPAARARRTGPPPRVPFARVLTLPVWTREERLWQLFRLASNRG